MQPKFLLSAIILCIAHISQAQNAAPFWSLAGNSNATPSSKLGTINANPLNLTTNNVPRIYIAANGRVGIGTTIPISQFHVEGPTLLSYFVSTDVLGAQSGSGVIGYTKFRPTAAGQRLGYFLTGSQGGGSDPGNGTGMAGYADGAWSSTSRPAYLTFETTKSGDRLRSEAMRIASYGYVGIGTSYPGYRLHVVDSNIAVYAISQGSSSYGVFAAGGYSGIQGAGNNFGVLGTGSIRGVYGIGNIGVYGESSALAGDGVHGLGTGSSGFGGYFKSKSAYGLLAYSENSDTYAAYFGGNVYASGVFTSSDKNLKKNITEFSDAVSIIKKLKPKTYEFKTDGKMAEMHLPKGRHYGLIAQDLESILPDLVKETVQYSQHQGDTSSRSENNTSATGQTFKAVNYTELIPILIKGMQEQDEEIETLKATVAELKAMLTNNTTGSLSSASLEVPVPNPAKESTNIRYNIPSGTASARLTVVNMLGQVMKEVKLSGGAGQLNLNVSGLAAGTYPCTLWVNGQQAVSKQLVIAH